MTKGISAKLCMMSNIVYCCDCFPGVDVDAVEAGHRQTLLDPRSSHDLCAHESQSATRQMPCITRMSHLQAGVQQCGEVLPHTGIHLAQLTVMASQGV